MLPRHPSVRIFLSGATALFLLSAQAQAQARPATRGHVHPTPTAQAARAASVPPPAGNASRPRVLPGSSWAAAPTNPPRTLLNTRPNWHGWSRGYWHQSRFLWPRWYGGVWTWVAVAPAYNPSLPAPGYGWSFCSSSNAYYPDVQDCPSGWTTVPAREPMEPNEGTPQSVNEGTPQSVNEGMSEGVSEPPPEGALPALPPSPSFREEPPPADAAMGAPRGENPPATDNSPPSKEPIYQWRDSSGTVHYTNVLSSIPSAYRTSAHPLATRKNGLSAD